MGAHKAAAVGQSWLSVMWRGVPNRSSNCGPEGKARRHQVDGSGRGLGCRRTEVDESC
ncbi:hypothetical protein BDV12DRAFT_170849 [Aspergillus spectabilis]